MMERRGIADALWVRALSLTVPSAYRREIVADLVEDYEGARRRGGSALAASGTLAWEMVRSALDSRRHQRSTGRHAPGAGLARDMAVAWRQYRQRPWLLVAVVVPIALTIGVNTAFVSVARAVIARPLPIGRQQSVGFVWSRDTNGRITPLSPGPALDVRARVRALSGVALISHEAVTVTGRGPAERWAGASVSSNFFDVLGAQPMLGAPFHAGQSDRDVVVLSYALWREKFGSDAAVIGRAVIFNGRARVITAVMPRDFFWPIVTPVPVMADGPLFWECAGPSELPSSALGVTPELLADRTSGYLRAVTRLAPSATPAQANAELGAIAGALGREHPLTDGGHGLLFVPLDEQFFGSLRRPLTFLVLASALVVLLACLNVANLLLVRVAGRTREFAVRSALGASPWRVTRQLLVEGALIAGAACTLGTGLAAASLRTVVALAPPVGRLDQVRIDGGVLIVTFLSAAAASLILGLVPAATAGIRRGAGDLRTAGAAPHRGRVRDWLVGLEVACAAVLVIGASLFGESLARLERVDVGFDTRHLLTFDVALSDSRAEHQSQQVAFFDDLLSALRRVPGVRAAGGAVTLPIGGDDFAAPLFVDGQPPPPLGAEPHVGYQIVGSGWFDALGVTLLRGRTFAPTDTRDHPGVVMVNATLAAKMWPGQDPLGRRVRFSRKPDAPWLTVVGVVSDIRHLGPGTTPRPEVYETYYQDSLPFLSIVVRTDGDPAAMAPSVRVAAARVDPAVPLVGISTMAEHLDRHYGDARVLSRLTLAFGLLALVLAALGVYSVVAASVTQRTREFGVRTALGATTGRLVGMVLRHGLMPVGLGFAAGAVAAGAAGQSIRSLLFDTAPIDRAAFLAAAVVVLGAGALASWLPARRAARIDPVVALRD